MPAPISKSSPTVITLRRPVVKFNFKLEEEKKTVMAEEIANKVTSRGDIKDETKIGWFRFSRHLEVVQDEKGNDKTIIRSKWTKMHTPRVAKRLPRRL
jgi:hypothetical protein